MWWASIKGFVVLPGLQKVSESKKVQPLSNNLMVTHPPERLSYKAFKKSHIARPSFKAEGYKRSSIPDCVKVANQLWTNVKQVTGKDCQPVIRSAVSAALNNNATRNSCRRKLNRRTTLAEGKSLLTTGNLFSLKNSSTTLSTPSTPVVVVD